MEGVKYSHGGLWFRCGILKLNKFGVFKCQHVISLKGRVCDHGNRGRFKRLGYYICFLSARVFKLLVGVTVFSVKTAGISVVIWSVMVNNC